MELRLAVEKKKLILNNCFAVHNFTLIIKLWRQDLGEEDSQEHIAVVELER